MASKVPIYTDENTVGDIALLNQIKEAVVELEIRMQAVKPIARSGRKVGWGIDKTQRGIAADAVIVIAKAIKSLKGW